MRDVYGLDFEVCNEKFRPMMKKGSMGRESKDHTLVQKKLSE